MAMKCGSVNAATVIMSAATPDAMRSRASIFGFNCSGVDRPLASSRIQYELAPRSTNPAPAIPRAMAVATRPNSSAACYARLKCKGQRRPPGLSPEPSASAKACTLSERSRLNPPPTTAAFDRDLVFALAEALAAPSTM